MHSVALGLSRITDATVNTFATCGFNFRMRKYTQCGPRLSRFIKLLIHSRAEAQKILFYILLLHA